MATSASSSSVSSVFTMAAKRYPFLNEDTRTQPHRVLATLSEHFNRLHQVSQFPSTSFPVAYRLLSCFSWWWWWWWWRWWWWWWWWWCCCCCCFHRHFSLSAFVLFLLVMVVVVVLLLLLLLLPLLSLPLKFTFIIIVSDNVIMGIVIARVIAYVSLLLPFCFFSSSSRLLLLLLPRQLPLLVLLLLCYCCYCCFCHYCYYFFHYHYYCHHRHHKHNYNVDKDSK